MLFQFRVSGQKTLHTFGLSAQHKHPGGLFHRVFKFIDEASYNLLLCVDGFVLAMIEFMGVLKDKNSPDRAIHLAGNGVVGYFSEGCIPDDVTVQHTEAFI